MLSQRLAATTGTLEAVLKYWLESRDGENGMTTGQTLAGRFHIADLAKDQLGRGVMGKVYRATDSQTGERVAVKALDPAVVGSSAEISERFRREGEVLRQLNHPNIVKMIASFEEAGRSYLVMEYVPGGSLQDLLIAQKRLPSRRVIQISLDLADALTRTHRLGIIHRDLKPANILLAEDGTPRLTDFGCAFLSDWTPLTQAGVVVGTAHYLSPEACCGEPVDARADIWALGVTVFELLSGQRPFAGSNFTATITAILMQPAPSLPALVPDVPQPLVALVQRMLEKDPRKRISSVELVGAELEAILHGGYVAQARAAA